MGFLKKLNPVRIVKKAVTSVAKNPLQGVSNIVATGGVNLISNKVDRTVSKITAPLYNPSTALAVAGAASGNPLLAASLIRPASGGNMGLDLGGIFGGALRGVSQALTQQYLPQVSSFGGYGLPGGDMYPDTYPVAGRGGNQLPVPRSLPNNLPVLQSLGRGVVSRRFFDKYPNLATDMQKWKNAGKNITRSQLYSWLKRFGQDFLITAGILSAASIAELIMAGPGRRTMNAANPKALRRAARRIKSFHKLCGTADLIKTRRSTRGFGRCGSCKKSPCRC